MAVYHCNVLWGHNINNVYGVSSRAGPARRWAALATMEQRQKDLCAQVKMAVVCLGIY